MASAIEIDQLSKCYRLGTDAAAYDTLREALQRSVRRTPTPRTEVWALRDISLRVEQAEALGIIGDNGAGKTTLLKLLAGITEPTSGQARVRGRVGALLDVGTGFHPELTGAENIYLNGAILGMRRRDVRRLFDEIVSFAGLERFLDTPVKRYSTGMRLRLAFAVAAHIEPPVVVVDEVLAVGDAAFREKCLGKMAEIGEGGRTVLFVSHDLGAVTSLCPRAVWLESGRVRMDGPTREVVAEYLRTEEEGPLVADFEVSQASALSVTQVAIRDSAGEVLREPQRDEPIVADVRFVLRDSFPALDVAFSLIDQNGVRVIWDRRSDWRLDRELHGERGAYRVKARIPPVLASGRYALELWIGSDLETLFEAEVLRFRIKPRPDDSQDQILRPRAAHPRLDWEADWEPTPS